MKKRSSLLGLFMLIIGVVIGYFLYPWLNFVEPDSSNSLIATDRRIGVDGGNKKIDKLRKKDFLVMKTNRSWSVQKTTLDTIMNQIDVNGNPVESLQLYPVIGEDNKLTIVLVGRTGNKLLLKQRKASSSGVSEYEVEGEVWDFIGPCPPQSNCPENETELVR